MKGWALGLIGAVCMAASASANAPTTSLRPVARGEVHPGVIIRVSPRVIGVAPSVKNPDKSIVYRSLRPRMRPSGLEDRAVERILDDVRGSVCGDPSILGTHVGEVADKVDGCGISDAVRVTSVAGIGLTSAALIDCPTAKSLRLWVERGLKPTIGRRGGGADKLRIFASYSCRTRNSKKGARISEHGKGRAVDIGAVILRDGSEVTVKSDWGRGRKGRMLRDLHEAACGPFGTVLGPKSDRYHRNHFHFDTARYRSGTYCK
ncbi:extensin family protein [Thalassobius vesicularis]|uniref:Extensin family protein n=1 Tax=Thalassobius vesicularis TaxID=1294297 RepID=A0A4S3M7X7_9RHOB|nr:extensin family protein [Thalassobius vesicularis]THD72092.1 extensin family protein [Thalassobius vesicularis]